MHIEFYNSQRLDFIKQLLTNSVENSKAPQDYEIRVDGMRVVPRTNNPELFDNYEDFITEQTRSVLVMLYEGVSRKNTKYLFHLKEEDMPKAQEKGLGETEVEKMISQRLEQQEQKWKQEQMEKELKELKEEQKQNEKDFEKIIAHNKKLEGERSLEDMQWGKIIGMAGDTLLKSNTKFLAKIPGMSGLAGIIEADNCTGQNSTLIASGGTNYSWSNGFTSSQIIVSPTSNTTYTVSVSNGLCTSDTNISILVNPSPIAIISGNTKLCLGQNTTLAASGGGNYLWSNGETNNSIFITPTASTNYFVTVTSTNGCADTANANIVITQMPVATINPNTTICEGTIITLNAGGGTTYLWSNGQTNTSILASPSTSTTYSVVAANGNCKDSIATIITVNPNPIASISSNINIFQGQSAILNASGGNMYLWNNGNTDSIITVMPNATTKYCVTVTDTSINRCTDTACVTVFVESPCDTAGTFFFPNAFSPNNDGENDALKIYYNEMNCISTLHLIIYDRWGELIYETSDKNFSWDGTYPGKPLNTQVLAYHLTVGFTDGKAINRKGNVSLVR